MPPGENLGRKPVVVIVGRPNVGKSTLFNRLVGQRSAIVENIPGTTRDRPHAEVTYRDRQFGLIDTRGLAPDAESGYSALIRAQAPAAATEADAILFAAAAVTGVTRTDSAI